jgi:hypothetical protein
MICALYIVVVLPALGLVLWQPITLSIPSTSARALFIQWMLLFRAARAMST